MKILVMYDYPASPGGLATQGDLLVRGLREIGVEAYPVHSGATQEKEWYYQWLRPDVAVGVGYWGHLPDIVFHPQKFGIRAVPWLVANGYMANYQKELNALPLVLVTSRWVKEVYERDGLDSSNIQVLPVGCDTDAFRPQVMDDPRVTAIRQGLGITPDQLMILTVGGDACSKGAREIMQALALIDARVPAWKYVCKVWPQPRTEVQNRADLQLAAELGIASKVHVTTSITSRNFMPYLIAACDIYAAPSRLEGFGMIQVEANACEKPVLSINAMGMRDTMVHGETALLAGIGEKIYLKETILGPESGYPKDHRFVFPEPRIADYRASVEDLAAYLLQSMNDAALRRRLGEAGRRRVVENFDYRVVARRFVETITRELGVT